MCWNPDYGWSGEVLEMRGLDDEIAPVETAGTEPDTTPDGDGRGGGRRRWPSVVRRASAVLVGIAVFAGGFFLHATVNWPDLHEGQELSDLQELQAKVTPHDGLAVQARWGDLLPQLVSAGVIDVEKFKASASRAGQPLTDDDLRLLADGGDDAIRIDMHNAKFVLNALWAVGLATDNVVLTQGPMARATGGAANLASTGGWTLGREAGPGYLGSLNLLPLTPEQRRQLNDVIYGVYRPCCNNPTAFPDCNHGMAALGLAEIMAYQGASADDIFRGLQAFNAYWYPDQYLTLAMYYKQRGIAWAKVDPRELLDSQHSGGAGWKQIDATVKQESPFLAPKSGGGGCGA